MAESLAEVRINFREQKEMSERIKELKARTARCVCRYCGKPLSLRKITYAAYDEAKIDIFCDHCDRIEFGVEPEVYKIAEYYVDEMQYDHYPELDDSTRKRRMNIAIICEILTWGYNNIGILGKDGFTINLQYKQELLGSALLISDTELRTIEKE
jgi:hypothetical protein